MVAGLLLARAGRRVAVVEAPRGRAVAVGDAHGQDLRFSRRGVSPACCIPRRRRSLARMSMQDREGVDRLLHFCMDHGVLVQRRPAITYAAQESELATVRQEHEEPPPSAWT